MEYDPNVFTNLCVVAGYFKSNKSKDNCNFSSLYNNMFDPYRQEELRVLEFESSNPTEHTVVGGSLQTWATYLSKSEIIGLFDNSEVDVTVSNERIRTFVCKDFDETFAKDEFQEAFDVIVDSTDHSFDEKIDFFQRCVNHHLVPQGFFFIEGLKEEDGEQISRQISDWKSRYPNCEFFYEVVHNPMNRTYHPLIIIQKMSVL
jgi:hypothetical protein